MDYEYVIAIIAGVVGIIALVITTICKYYGEKSTAEEDKKTLGANPDMFFIRENVFDGGKTRHGICQHYHQLLYQNIAKLMQNLDPNNPSRNKAYTHPLRMEMCHTALVFKRNVMEFLDADMKKYLVGETLQRCIRINVHFEASNNFYNLSVNKPESNLLRYSKFFNDLFYVCQMINISVKERNAESPEIIAIANDIDALIAEYKPIAQIFEELKQNTGKVIDKINERWGDKITKVNSMKDVSEKTLYIIFEDMLFYIEKYYTYMDDIRDITIRRMAGI